MRIKYMSNLQLHLKKITNIRYQLINYREDANIVFKKIKYR